MRACVGDEARRRLLQPDHSHSTHTQTHKYAYTYIHRHTDTDTQTQTHTHSHRHTQTHTGKRSTLGRSSQTRPSPPVFSPLAHPGTHTRTHTHIDTYIHTRNIHMHTQTHISMERWIVCVQEREKGRSVCKILETSQTSHTLFPDP